MLTDVSEVRTASIIALMMEAVSTYETSVNIYLTIRQYIPEDCKLQSTNCSKDGLQRKGAVADLQ
jgi:hypothetical protein